MSIRPFYDRWPQYNRRLVEAVRGLGEADLAIPAGSHGWPIWAMLGHTAGGRTYWLCRVVGEPFPDGLPFDPTSDDDWSDDLDHPHPAAEVIAALEASFLVVDRILDEWTPEGLSEEVERAYGDVRQVHTRASILQRLLTHEAWHAAEMSAALGAHGLPEIDLWRADPPG
jgi:uncharacterized damage-inducible protein DinB